MVQLPVGPDAGSASVLDPLLSLLFAACGGALLVAVLQLFVPRARRAARARTARRRRRRAAWSAELRARAMMDELCPHGWRAQIILLGASDQLPGEAPGARRDRVSLDWIAFEADRSSGGVVRRVSAPTINEALEAMVADRRTDETLERIEQAALADGDNWPDA